MLKTGTFVRPSDKIYYFYQYFQKLYAEMQKKESNIQFIGSLDFDFIENLPNDGTNYLLIFDDSCDKISRSKQFEKTAIAGRHRKRNCIYINHNLFHKSANQRDTELQNAHCSVQVTTRCSTNWCSRKTTWFGKHSADVVRWCYIDSIWSFNDWFITKNDLLRYCADVTSFLSKFYFPSSRSRITQPNDQKSGLLFSKALFNFQQRIFLKYCSKDFIRFLCECCKNLQGNLKSIEKIKLYRSKNTIRKLVPKKLHVQLVISYWLPKNDSTFWKLLVALY